MDLAKLISEKKTLIFDGGLGTELARKGFSTDGSINLTGPEELLKIHQAYAETGVDFLTTNTFNLNRIAAEAHGLAADLEEANRRGVHLAQRVAGPEQYVCGDLGPTGKLLQPYGTYTEEHFTAAFAEQARILVAAGVDLLIIETMTDLREAVCALQACLETSDLPVIVTLSFATTEKGGRTIMGSSIAEVAATLSKLGASAIGANCGELSPLEMAELVTIYRQETDLPILAQPNAGKPKFSDGKTSYDMLPPDFVEGVLQCAENGAALVGGCCGTTPAHLQALVKKLR